MSDLKAVTVRRSKLVSFILGTVAIFATVLIAVHFLRPGVDISVQFIDAYQRGAYSSIYNVTLMLFGAGQLALALGLYRALPGSIPTTIGVVLLGYWAVGTLLLPVLPVPQPDAPPTVMGTLAQINGPLHIISLSVGALLVSWCFKDDEALRPARGSALILSGAMPVLFISTAVAMPLNVAGLAQRIFVVLTLAWSTLVALKLRD